MGFKRAIERIKKRIKRKKGLLLASFVLFPVIVLGEGNVPYEVIVHKVYVCGEQYVSLGMYGSDAAEKLKQDHPEWKVEGIDEGKVIFTERLEDLSPECRQNAYMGLDSQGSLALFEGKPEQGKVIRSFFQLNIQQLENSLPTEAVQDLLEGIRVTDYAEYNSVLSTFSDYAMDEAEQVVKPNFK